MKKAYFLLLASCALFSCGEDKAAEEAKPVQKSDTIDTAVQDTTALDTSYLDTIKVELSAKDTVVKKVSVEEKLNDGKEGKAEAATSAKKFFDLSQYGYNILIQLPKETEISVGTLDEAILKFGNDFEIEVMENYEGDLQTQKAGFKGNKHNQMLGYVIEDDNGFVRKIKSNGVLSHNLVYLINDGSLDLIISSSRSKKYSQDEIMEMWKACKTIKVKE